MLGIDNFVFLNQHTRSQVCTECLNSKHLSCKTFEHHGKTLAEVWLNIVFKGHPCLAEYVSVELDQHIEEKLEKWKKLC